MNQLHTRFALVFCFMLLVATLLPMLIFYLLGRSGLIEVTYATESLDVPSANMRLEAFNPTPPVIPSPDVTSSAQNQLETLPQNELRMERRDLIWAYDQASGQWMFKLPSYSARAIVTSPISTFRIDVPAWLMIGALPVLSLSIGLAMSIWMSRGVTKPISQLAQAAQAVGRRELGYRVTTSGSQELQELAHSFNRMAEDLEAAELARRNLTADIAHELRTPLSVLEGNLRAMLDGVHEISEEEIALLYEQSQHLKHLVEDLRELSLAEAGQLLLKCHELDLGALVRETAGYFDVIAQEHGIKLSTELEESLLHPSLDERRMRQVLHNLLSNAIHHTPVEGQVTISASRLPGMNAVEISVVDTGTGISAEALPYIFDRFNRCGEMAEREGTGLGLAIAKAIIEAHGGTVSAQSAGKNQGSIFTIFLPC
jgi:two-component system OmpR family sensor kinase/two-component system sensor histidine kinase BaeS